MIEPISRLMEEAGAAGGGGGAPAAPNPPQDGQNGGGGQPTGGGNGQPWFGSWIKPDGSFDHAALEKLPDNFKDAKPTLQRYGKIEDLVQAFDNQRRIISLKGLTPLRSNATDAEKQAWRQDYRKFVGAPDKPEGYTDVVKRPDSVPEEHWSQEFADHMAKIFNDSDLSAAQAKSIVDGWSKFQQDAFKALETHEQQTAAQRLQENNAKLDQAFGMRRPAMEQLAVRGALAAGVDPNSDAFKNSPDMIIAMARVASMLGEDKLPRPEGAPGGADVEAEYQAMHNDPGNRYYNILRNSAHPQYKEALQRRDFLAEQIARNKAASRTV